MDQNDTSQAANYASKFFSDKFDVSYLAGGTSSAAYSVSASGFNPLVMLVELPNAAHAVDYGNNFAVLRLLESNNYKHAPKAYWLSDDHKAIIMDKVPGQSLDDLDFSSVKFNKKDLALAIVDAAYQTTSMSHEAYLAICQENNIKPMPIATQDSGIKTYYIDRFEKSKKLLGPDHEFISWLEPKYQKIVEHPFRPQTDKLVFEHTDPSNPNIIVDAHGDTFSVAFVDWGNARFSYSSPEFYAGYMTQLVDFMADYRQVIIDYVATKLDLNPVEFLRTTTEFRKELKVGDIIWAVMMYALCYTGKLDQDKNKYLEITKKRIREYEEEFIPA